MRLVRPDQHWEGAVKPLLEALTLRGAWVPGSDELSRLVRGHSDQLGYTLVAGPDTATDAVVVSGDPNYRFVSSCLAAAADAATGGDQGPPLIIVGATGWPHENRDGHRDLEQTTGEVALAARLPDPDGSELSTEPAKMSYAATAGGPRNGVRAAIDDALGDAGWDKILIEGFGGIAILVPTQRTEKNSSLTGLLTRLRQSQEQARLARLLDLSLGRLELEMARMSRVSGEHEAAVHLAETALTDLHNALEQRLAGEEETLSQLAASVLEAQRQIRAGIEHERWLEQRLTATEALVSAARTELAEERDWVARHARAISRSQSWRLGHRLVRTMRIVTFRRDRGTDAVNEILRHLEGQKSRAATAEETRA